MSLKLFALAIAAGAVARAYYRYWSTYRSSGDMRLHKLAPNVYIYRGFFSNSGAMLFPSGWVIVDSQVSPLGGKRLREALTKVADRPFLYVFNTHHHGDHLGGNAIFPEATIVGTEETAGLAIARADDRITYANTFGLGFQEIHPNVPPGETFRGEFELTLDGMRICARQVGRAETDDACIVWFPNHGVVCSGDGVATWDYPFLGTPFLDEGLRPDGEWIRFLEAVRDLHTRVLIPGHGPALVGEKRIFARCELLRNLFSDLVRETEAALSALGPTNVAAIVKRVDARLARYRRNRGLKETTLCQRYAIYRVLNGLLPDRKGKGWWNDLRPSVAARDSLEIRAIRRSEDRLRAEAGNARAEDWGMVADLWFDASRKIKPRVEGSELWTRAAKAAERALAIDPAEPQALAVRGALDVLGGLMFAQPMDVPIRNLVAALASGKLTRAQAFKARFFLGKAYQATGDSAKRDASFRALFPRVGFAVLPIVRPILLRYP